MSIDSSFDYRIDNFDKWKNSTNPTKWMLLSGALDPPQTIEVSQRRSRKRSGNFLAGVAKDIANMEDALRINGLFKYNTVKNDRLTKKDAVQLIAEFFRSCEDTHMPVLYYTGHGQCETGCWCFSDGVLSYVEIMDLRRAHGLQPLLICDCCFSGQWCVRPFQGDKSLYGDCPLVLAACGPFEDAIGYPDLGSELTLYITGRIGANELCRKVQYGHGMSVRRSILAFIRLALGTLLFHWFCDFIFDKVSDWFFFKYGSEIYKYILEALLNYNKTLNV